jgi:hypothetical protein
MEVFGSTEYVMKEERGNGFKKSIPGRNLIEKALERRTLNSLC